MAARKLTLEYRGPIRRRHAVEKRAVGIAGACIWGAIAAYCVAIDFTPGVILFGTATVGFALVAAKLIR